MRIANVLRRFAFDEWGGTESAVWNASKILKRKNFVELLCTKALCETANETADGIDIKRYDYFYPHINLSAQSRLELDKKGGNPFSFGLYRQLLSGDYDIVHTHAMGRIAKLVCKAARKKNIPYVVSFHGGNYDVPQSEFDEMAKPLKGSFGYGRIVEKIFGLECDIVEEADGVICVGENELAEIKKRFPEKTVAYIPNGVDAKKFGRKTRGNFRNKFSIPQNRKLLLCVSRIDYQKNQRALVKLAEKLLSKGEDVHIAIVGFVTSTGYLKGLEDDIKSARLGDRFTIVKGLNPDDELLVSAYQNADAFVLPSVHEPFGIVAIEAWSAGLPLLASRVGGLKTLVEDSITGYTFAPDDIDEMCDAYFRAKSGGIKTAANAKILAETKYSWEAVVKSIEEFYCAVKKNAGK